MLAQVAGPLALSISPSSAQHMFRRLGRASGHMGLELYELTHKYMNSAPAQQIRGTGQSTRQQLVGLCPCCRPAVRGSGVGAPLAGSGGPRRYAVRGGGEELV